MEVRREINLSLLACAQHLPGRVQKCGGHYALILFARGGRVVRVALISDREVCSNGNPSNSCFNTVYSRNSCAVGPSEFASFLLLLFSFLIGHLCIQDVRRLELQSLIACYYFHFLSAV